MADKITMEHGSGGRATGELIDEIFAGAFSNEVLSQMEDSAVVPGSGRIAVTTDSFVVTPVIFPGGTIGRLCVCGTVNDLLMRGAVPKYLTCGFILEEGLEISVLQQVVADMAATAKEAGVMIVAGDTKVVEGHGGMYINTTGVGFVPETVDIKAANARPGDAILVSGNMGDHHAAVLGTRMGIENTIVSDNAPLNEMVKGLIGAGLPVHVLRDITRGGLGTVLKELAEASGQQFDIRQTDIPVDPQVRDFCGLLGLDPIYMGNEGKMVVILPEEYARQALEIMHHSPYGADAVRVGSVCAPETEEARGRLILHTRIGGKRVLDVLQGEGLPRIC